MAAGRKSRTLVASVQVRRRAAVNHLAIFAALSAALVVALTSEYWLPERFFRDSSTIRDFIDGNEPAFGPSPYSSTAFLFRVLGMGESELIASLLSVVLFAIATFLALRSLKAQNWSILLTVLAVTSIVLASVYLSRYSKEFFVLPLVALFMITATKRAVKYEVAWILSLLLYAFFVREYWFLIVALYVGVRLALRFWRPGLLGLVLGLGVASVGLVVVFNVLLGLPATAYRTAANEGLVTDRATIITDFLPATSWIFEITNLQLILLFLVFPIPLAFAGSAIHFASSLVIGGFWVTLFRSFLRANGKAVRSSTRRERRWPSVDDSASEKALAWILAYVLTQALFEPDYGSYLRHLVPLLPVFIFYLVRNSEWKNVSESSMLRNRSVAASFQH